MVLIPDKIRVGLREAFRKQADDRGYMSMTRPEAGVFLDEMVNEPSVGKVIKEYMSDDKVRTYIKDALLNRYVKSRAKPSGSLVSAVGKHWANPKEVEKVRKLQVTIFDSDNGKIVAVTANYRKYESGLRKLLEFVACRVTPAGKKERFNLALCIHNPGGRTNHGDQVTAEKALSFIGVKAIWI